MATVLCVIGGLILGVLVAFINSKISKKGIDASTTGAVMGINFFRFILDIIALAVGFFVSRAFNLPQIPTLVAIAVGLSVGSMLFLYFLSKNVSKEEDEALLKKKTSLNEKGKVSENQSEDNFTYSSIDESFDDADLFSSSKTTMSSEDISVSQTDKN